MKLTFEINRKENRYEIKNKKKELLGFIFFHDEWDFWVWEQERDIIMSKGCLKQIVDKLKTLDELEMKVVIE